MAGRDDFSAAEWALLGDAPLAAAAAVALSSEGGGTREAAAIVSGWREAGQLFPESELIAQIVTWLDPEEREAQKPTPATRFSSEPSYQEILEEALNLCARAAVLLDERATPQDSDDYRGFVLHIAERVANANSESGLFGLGGEPMSRDERGTLRAIARALGV